MSTEIMNFVDKMEERANRQLFCDYVSDANHCWRYDNTDYARIEKTLLQFADNVVEEMRNCESVAV